MSLISIANSVDQAQVFKKPADLDLHGSFSETSNSIFFPNGTMAKHSNYPLKCNRQKLRYFFLFSGIYLIFIFIIFFEKPGYVFDVESLASVLFLNKKISIFTLVQALLSFF